MNRPHSCRGCQRCIEGLSGEAISLRAAGLTTGDAQGRLWNIDETEASSEASAGIADEVLA